MSLTSGIAGGLLVGAASLDMVSLALDFGGLAMAMAGFAAGAEELVRAGPSRGSILAAFRMGSEFRDVGRCL